MSDYFRKKLSWAEYDTAKKRRYPQFHVHVQQDTNQHSICKLDKIPWLWYENRASL